VQGEKKFTSVTSKPAPFAEKKNAKDAAPENSMRGSIQLRCDAEGFATRRPGSSCIFPVRKSCWNDCSAVKGSVMLAGVVFLLIVCMVSEDTSFLWQPNKCP